MVYVSLLEINNKASKVAHDLANRTQLTARIGIWDRDAILITMLVIPHGQYEMATQIGPRIPAYCTALGKAILAYIGSSNLENYLNQTELIPYTPLTITHGERIIEDLRETRKKGYSVSDREMLPSSGGIAAPIFKRDGRLAAAISLGAMMAEMLLNDRLKDLAGELVSAAYEISQKMGFTPAAAQERAFSLL